MPVDLHPTPGFCIKTSTLQPAIYSPSDQNQPNSNLSLLEPRNAPIPVPKGLKVFVNIAWDSNVPPPPESSEEAIQRAMMGEDIDEIDPDSWYVPVIVSEGRQDSDKAGKPCLVFDCVYSTSLKSRTLRDPEFKTFLIELGLQRVEAQTHLFLSRQIGTPNIASKGKLTPRTVSIPSFLSPDATSTVNRSSKPKLIQEISPSSTDTDTLPKLRGILKTRQHPDSNKSPTSVNNQAIAASVKPRWSWAKQDNQLQITIRVPKLTHNIIPLTTLDLEPRRLILQIPAPAPYTLDINLNLSDAEIVSNANGTSTSAITAVNSSIFSGATGGDDEPQNTLTLKRQRELNVDAAKAEWRVEEGVLVVTA